MGCAALFAGAAAAAGTAALGPVVQTFASYGVEDGLPSLSTTDLALDADDNLWVGTQEGVVRFDGERFRTFGVGEGLPSGLVFDVEIDGTGGVWVGTLKGLARLAGDRFLAVELPGAPAGEPVEALGVDADGRLLAGALGGVYRCAVTGCGRVFVLPADEFVSAIAFDRTSGQSWFAGPFGLVRWRDQELERWTTARGLPSHATRALTVDRFGVLWIRQARHLARLDTAARTLAVEPGLASATDASAVIEDRTGVVWVASDRGVFHSGESGWTRIGTEHGLPGEGVAAMIEDHEGALWIGTAYAGLVRWLGRDRFSSWTRETGLPNEVVWAIERGSDGSLAFGTQEGLAVVAPGGRRITTYDRESGLAGEFVLSLASDGDGGFWIGTARGLEHLDAAGGISDVGAGLLPPGSSVTALARGPAGELWLGTTVGLWRSNGRPLAFELARVELPPAAAGGAAAVEVFFDVLVEPSGVVWAAGRYGLARLENGAWRRLGRADGLRDDFVGSITRAGDGALWIGYRDGFGVSELRWQGETPLLRHYGRADGLRHEQVTFVRADALGRIWIGTSRGLSVRTPRGFIGFGRSDGLPSEDSCTNAFFADRDGTAWIGTPRGAVAGRLSRDDLQPRPPLEARVLSLALGGEPLDPAAATRVPYTARTLEVAYAARTFRAPHEVEFRYQLLGVDETPVVTSVRSLRYPALPHGEHRFVVAARRVGGEWGPPATARFAVAPPWWATLPAKLGALGAAALLGLAFDRARTRRLRARRAALERAVAERTRELAANREELARKNDELAHLSLTDPLTGLRNRRSAWDFLAEEVARVDREWSAAGAGDVPEARLVFFLMDVDLFKSINDLHGHEVGDRILVEAAERVREASRLSDIAVRWGGEEFLVVARDLPESEWSAFAKRLRESIAKPAYTPSPEVGPVGCTASLGYAAYPFDPQRELGWQQVLRLADLALYAVKQCGRDADLGVEPGTAWRGQIPSDLLAAQASGTVRLRWGNVSRSVRV
jgi:diguanylate cyclase (GGDEF)-like protein